MIDIRTYFIEQEPALRSFIARSVAPDAAFKPLAQDWGSRRYFRACTMNQSFVVMQAVPDHIETATMGHKLSAFIRVAKLLEERGLRAPSILEMDEAQGFVLLEDFGDMTLGKAMVDGMTEESIYQKATDVLIELRDRVTLDDLCAFPKYKDSYIRKGRQRIVDWYLPATRRVRNDDAVLESYIAAWDAVSAALPAPRIGFIHGDFHLQNLMLLKDGDIGLLDFQDAMAGPVVYDLGNLLENIRTDVPPALYAAMRARYGIEQDESMRAWFRVMATQFHCRLLGQVLRLSVLSGKDDLVGYIPRIQGYLINALKDPVLKPLEDWFRSENVDLSAQGVFDPDTIRRFIREDAF